MRKILRRAAAAAGVALVLGAMGLFATHRYVNYLAPSEEELAQEIAFLREKLRPGFPPEENRAPLYAAFVERIDPSLKKTMADYREARRYHRCGPRPDEAAEMQALMKAMSGREGSPGEEGSELRDGDATSGGAAAAPRTWGEDPRITAENAWKYDEFCRGVDALRDEFKSVTQRGRCRLLDAFTVEETFGSAYQRTLGGMGSFVQLLSLRGEVARATGDVTTVVACVRTMLLVASDILYHAELVQMCVGERDLRLAAELTAELLGMPGVATDTLSALGKAWSAATDCIVPVEEALLPRELTFLTLDDVDSVASRIWPEADAMSLRYYSLLYKFMLPGVRGAAMRVFRAARASGATAAQVDDLRREITANAHGNFLAAGAAYFPVELVLPPKRGVALCPVYACVIRLALELHRRAHGGYPPSLSDLDKAVLREVPLDPYSGRPFVYRRNETGYVLYGVGPDGEDDGGMLPDEALPPDSDADDVVYANPDAGGGTSVEDAQAASRERKEITPDIPLGTSLANLTNSTTAVPERNSGTAVRAALEWLRRHQNEDGSWSCRDFTSRCDKSAGPCTNHPENVDPAGNDGRGWKKHDIGVTALAMLAFTGYGHTHRAGMYDEYVEVLRKACEFMRSVQIRGMNDPKYDGCFRKVESIPKDKSKEAGIDEDQQWMYDHAIATMAMAELLALSGDVLCLRRTVEDAAMFCIRAQNEGWGWRYGVKPGDNDTSVTGWMVLALKAVATCRMLEYVRKPSRGELDRSWKGALKWLDHATSSSTGFTGYKSPGDEGSRLPELDELKGGYPFTKEQSCMTAVSVLCRLFAGQSRSNDTIKKGVVNVLMKHPPKWQKREGKVLSTINFCYWYYGTEAMFQYGGGLWKEWNDKMQDALLPTQRVLNEPQGRSCEDGSWDPIDEWSLAGGRVYVTAMGALALEVMYPQH